MLREYFTVWLKSKFHTVAALPTRSTASIEMKLSSNIMVES